MAAKIKCTKCNVETPNTLPLMKCGHNICYECMCNHLKVFDSALIICPIDGCRKVISDFIIRKCLSNEQLEYYDSLCYAPNTVKCLIDNCFYFISYTVDGGHFICPICHQPNCVTCKKLHDINDHCSSVINYDPKPFVKAAKKYLQEECKNNIKLVSDRVDLVSNYEGFSCQICNNFILPREGISLRNCQHTFCRPCLTDNYQSHEHLSNFSCPLCSKKLSDREIFAFIGKEKAQNLGLNIVKSALFNCQSADCKGMWDFTTFTGKHTCPICKVINCGNCKDVHGDLTCEQFQESARYKDAQICIGNIEKSNKIKCSSCKTIIIKNKGCNALRCPTCKLQVCAFSGMQIGPDGCKCTKKARCHPSCSPGCIPEGNTPYEQVLKKYFYDN